MLFKKIVFCTDFSDNSNNAFTTALEIAKTNHASLDVLHVREPIVNFVYMSDHSVPGGPLQYQMSMIEAEMEKRYGSKIDPDIDSKIIVREGHPSSEILDYLKEVNADLVVTGSAGFSGMGLVIFGSVSKRIAHKSPCNVLIARQKIESL